jgi:alpha-1,2-mannosyltransferase
MAPVPVDPRPHWLTARRVRVHGLLLAVCMWSVYAWNFSTPGLLDRQGLLKGTDFLHFYTIGSLALQHRGDELYNMAAQAELAHKLVPESAGISYLPLYGPQVSLLFSPFARLSYGWALAAWLLLSAVVYLLCCFAVWRECPKLCDQESTVLILAIAYPAFFHLIAWGQTSVLALVFFTLAFLALRSERRLLAGLAFGILIFKPQLGLAAAFIFLFANEWKIVLGAMVSAVVELAAAWAFFGKAVMADYANHLLRVGEVLPLLEPRPYQLHSLRAFWSLLLPWPGVAFWLCIITSLALLISTTVFWRSPSGLGLRYAALLLCTVLVSPHLTVYDLTILAPAFLLLADWATSHLEDALPVAIAPLLYLCYALPLAGPLARWTHVQLSVVAMVILLGVVVGMSQGARSDLGS